MPRQLEKYTVTSGKKPIGTDELVPSELALNITDARMFLKNGASGAASSNTPNVEFNEWEPGLTEVSDATTEAASIALRDAESFSNGQYCFRRISNTDGDGFKTIIEILELYSIDETGSSFWFEIERYEQQPLSYKISSVTYASDGARYGIHGGAMSYRFGTGAWKVLNSDTNLYRFPEGGNNFEMRELIPGSVTQLIVDDDGSSGGRLHGTIKISGGELQNLSSLCHDLTDAKTIDVRDLNTEHVTNMSGMFKWCREVTEIDVSRMNTDKATTMQSMFVNCYALQSLDLSSFNFENVTDVSTMFESCDELTCITNINTLNATTKINMFNGCDALVQPDSAAQNELLSASGTDWVNPKICEGSV